MEDNEDEDAPYIKMYLDMCEQGKTCDEYTKKGTCRHIYYLNFDDYKHKNCPTVEQKGDCNHLRGQLWRWIAKYTGDMEQKLRAEVEFADFEHASNCRVTEEHGACFHIVDVLTSFRTKKENWELAWMHRKEFDQFFHEDCADYVNFGTCVHVDGINLAEFEHNECNEFAEQKKCDHLKECISVCTSRFTGDELIIRSNFTHTNCEQYEMLGKCFHIEDLIARKVFYEEFLSTVKVQKNAFMTPMSWESERKLEHIAATVTLDKPEEIIDDHEDDGY